MINAGSLRERVTVQQASESRNALGENVLSWATFAERWASVEGVSARESLAYGQNEITVTHKVKMRYLSGLTQRMRLQWRGRTLEIVSLLEHNNRSEHEAICMERQGG
jgi:SPP1 family predicted phage head-tail adaptor